MAALTSSRTRPGEVPPPPLSASQVSAPEIAPPVVEAGHNAGRTQPMHAARIGIRRLEVHAPDVGVDDHLGAHDTGRHSDEHDLVRAVCPCLYQSVGIRMETAPPPWLGAVAGVGQAASVAV